MNNDTPSRQNRNRETGHTSRAQTPVTGPITDEQARENLRVEAERVNEFLSRQIEFKSPDDSRLLTTWIVAARMFRHLPAVARMRIRGPKESGKSTTQDLAMILAGGENYVNGSAAALFYAASRPETTGPVAIGEIERFLKGSSDRHQMEAIIADGYAKTAGKAIRRDGAGVMVSDSYFPMMVSGIESTPILADLTSRMITIDLTPESADHWFSNDRMTIDPEKEAEKIRDGFWGAITEADHLIQNELPRKVIVWGEPIIRRDWQIWGPLVAIARVIGSEWEQSILAVAHIQTVRDYTSSESSDDNPDAHPIINGLFRAMRSGLIAPKDYANPRDLTILSEAIQIHTNMDLYDLGWRERPREFMPRHREGFHGCSLKFIPKTHVFELRWTRDGDSDMVAALSEAMKMPGMTVDYMMGEFRDSGLLRTQGRDLSIRDRLYRESPVTRVRALSLGTDSRIGWADMRDKTPDGE